MNPHIRTLDIVGYSVGKSAFLTGQEVTPSYYRITTC